MKIIYLIGAAALYSAGTLLLAFNLEEPAHRHICIWFSGWGGGLAFALFLRATSAKPHDPYQEWLDSLDESERPTF